MPFVLWATIWRHPRTPAHALSYLPLRHLYRRADAVATYGPHVSAYVRGKGARGAGRGGAAERGRRVLVRAGAAARRHAAFQALFAGRLEAEKGVEALLAAWARVDDAGSALVMLGDGPLRERAVAAGAVVPAGPLAPAEVRAYYAGSDVVVVPSIPTRDFLEPWGLVVNEAFHRGVPVVATTAVGAVAGGLARHERTALVVAPGDPEALAAALRRLRDDPALRARLGAAARDAVAAYSHDAWADGMQRALAAAGASRGDGAPG